jgi:dTDP-4-dehydrorhamnose 3,5-epimerase
LARVFCEGEFARHGLATRFVQASTIYSAQCGTLRGLHYQDAPHREVKLVRCTRGAAHVVIVDLRVESPTYRRWTGVELTPANGRLLYVPEGFAQGYQTVADDTEVAYQMSHQYVPSAARGVRWDDPAFGIDWPAAERLIISQRDRSWPDHAR